MKRMMNFKKIKIFVCSAVAISIVGSMSNLLEHGDYMGFKTWGITDSKVITAWFSQILVLWRWGACKAAMMVKILICKGCDDNKPFWSVRDLELWDVVNNCFYYLICLIEFIIQFVNGAFYIKLTVLVL